LEELRKESVFLDIKTTRLIILSSQKTYNAHRVMHIHWSTHTYMYAHTHTHTHTYIYIQSHFNFTEAHTHTCTHARTHTHTFTSSHTLTSHLNTVKLNQRRCLVSRLLRHNHH